MKNSIDNGGVLDKEFEIILFYQILAEKNIRKKRGFIISFFKELPQMLLPLMLFPLFPTLSIKSERWNSRNRWNDREVEVEYERLMKKEGRNKLKELRPDLYG